ncbi:hypothetical protein HMPREF0662_02449 [Prevotella nigrescens F0103]|nr:hypothetical protein HMPREF0662_02449 [Prevotella nigrescens F0103]SUB92426.1 Uncharacterised protein [Prevotella nigrescens]
MELTQLQISEIISNYTGSSELFRHYLYSTQYQQ